MEARFRKIIERTPTEPGVYLMRDGKGKIFYIGKSNNLRARLRSYFTGSDPRPFVRRLSRILADIETLIVRNEKEALLLENRLIKAHKPRFNVKLRDDKNYLSLRIDPATEWPRVQVVRRARKDGALYFGPYHSASAVRQTLRILNRHFGLRTCKDSVLHNRTRPCLQYQIKRCPAPCVLDVDREAYEQRVRDATMFLQGRQRELVKTLNVRMAAAAEDLEYELAAQYRDQLRDVDRSLMKQQIESVQRIDQDVLGFYREGDAISIVLLFVRRGVVTGTRRFGFTKQEFPDEEVISSFLTQYYSGGVFVPNEVMVPVLPELSEGLEEMLGELRLGRVHLTQPKRGNKRALLDTAVRNAEQAFVEQLRGEEMRKSALISLQRRLHLKQLPMRIECFDISNLGDDAIVGSMVVFEDGEAKKSDYRTFRVKTVARQDDFASLVEVLSRRVLRSLEGDWPWPDLLVVDGGKGQLNRVIKALEDLGVHHLEVVGLAKARRLRRKGDPDSDERSDERVFLPMVKDPISLRRNTAERHLMERIRDEAHRVAVSYNQKLRRKRKLTSALDQIAGVGPARKKALLAHFGSIRRIQAATYEELLDVPGVSAGLARRIVSAIQP